MLKRLLAAFSILLLASSTQAHFIWLVPQKNGQVQMVFSDSLEPDANVPITKIAQTVVSLAGKGEVKKTQEKDHYLITTAVKSPFEVIATCKYGVSSKSPYLLMYYAKTTVGSGKNEVKSTLPLEIVSPKAGVFQVYWQGKLTTDAEVTALIGDDSRTLTAQKDGTFVLGPMPKSSTATIGLRAKLVEKKAGDLDGKKYEEVRHYSTWTFSGK